MKKFSNRALDLIVADVLAAADGDEEEHLQYLTDQDMERLSAVQLPELTGDFYVIKPNYELVRTGRKVWNEREQCYTEATHWAVTGWSVVGTASSISDAKRQGFIAPVLQDCKSFDAEEQQFERQSVASRMYMQRTAR